MVGLSDHTKLMNIVIGLCYNTPHWPNPFIQKNYKITKIEANISEANPDIIISNAQKNHSIFIECKSSHNVNEKQIIRYSKVQENPSTVIQSGKIKIIHKDQYSIDTTYCSFEDLSSNDLVCKYNMLCLHVERIDDSKINSIYLVRGNFSKNGLNAIFPIDTSNSKPPYFLYPFSENDKELFTKEILNQLQKFGFANKKFTVSELLAQTHSLWKFIDDKKKFEGTARSILLDLQKKGLQKYLKRDKNGKWSIKIKPDNRSFQAFRSICMSMIDRLDNTSYQDVLNFDDN